MSSTFTGAATCEQVGARDAAGARPRMITVLACLHGARPLTVKHEKVDISDTLGLRLMLAGSRWHQVLQCCGGVSSHLRRQRRMQDDSLLTA
jgi:hypothetical protein